MTFKIIALVVITILLVTDYALLVVAHDADERAERMYRKWKEKDDKKIIRIVSEESPCTNCSYKGIIPCCCCMEFIAWKRKLLRMKGADDDN